MNTILHYRVEGENDPTLVFVHGFACEIQDWQPLIVALGGRYRCVTLDLPGHGRSGKAAEATVAELARAVNTVRTQSAGRPVILVGHSLGCKVIREAYAMSQADVVGMIFIEGAFYMADRAEILERARSAVDGEGFPAFADRHFRAMFTEDTAPSLMTSVLNRLQTLDPSFGRDLYLDAVGWDPARGIDTLKCIDVPVLVLQSTFVDANLKRRALEPGVETPFMRAVRENVADASVKPILGYGHFPMLETPETVALAINEFVRRFARAHP
jgi:pimeloyl-ACP methyl ester carboxylesterase